jgi:hypothetical protein
MLPFWMRASAGLKMLFAGNVATELRMLSRKSRTSFPALSPWMRVASAEFLTVTIVSPW